MSNKTKYQHPLVERYLSNNPLATIFSEENRIQTWRRLWVWLAESQFELGLECITSEMVENMKESVYEIDWQMAAKCEKDIRHDVMAHVITFGSVATQAKGIIHLGATSAYIQDNADLIIMKQSLDEVTIPRVSECLSELRRLCVSQKEVVTVGRTHYQPASLTTVGKRAAIWTQDILMGLQQLVQFRHNMRFRGVQSATGSQASFLCLFDGDAEKVVQLNDKISEKAGFEKDKVFKITGQTYTRQQDAQLMCCFALIATAVNKMCLDIRMLQSYQELMEPFEDKQVGSSAMPYKRNPMRCERVCGFARSLKALISPGLDTAETQGFERTLDDSSCRRIFIPEGFILMEAMLNTVLNIVQGLRVCHSQIEANVSKELPFLALEQVMMKMTLEGADRQAVHENIRTITLQAHKQIDNGETADVVELIRNDSVLNEKADYLAELIDDPKLLIGRCADQVQQFVDEELSPFIDQYVKGPLSKVNLNV